MGPVPLRGRLVGSASVRAGALLATLVACAGCGVSATGYRAQSVRARPAPTAVAGTRRSAPTGSSRDNPDSRHAAAVLPTRPPGELVLAGYSPGSLALQADRMYQQQGGPESLRIESGSAAAAFEKFCAGDVDLVDSSSEITSSEDALCEQNRITPVQIQVASDALVFATENETDVGADCLTLPQVRAIMRAGSPVSNWSQLGFDRVGLQVAGLNPSDSQFGFFGQLLTGSSNFALDDLRYDYRLEPGEAAIRRFLVGDTQTTGGGSAAGLPQALAELQDTQNLIRGWRATERGAAQWMRSSQHWNQTAQYALALAKHSDAVTETDRLLPVLAGWQAAVAHDRSVRRQALGLLGRLGVFGYGYYTLYEQQLRPLEISAATTPENCSFPSAQTVTDGDYPLSRRMLLTFSLQALHSNDGEREFLLSYLKNANTLANEDDLVPLPAQALSSEQDWLEGHAARSGRTSTPQPAPKSGEQTSMSAAGGAAGAVTQTVTDSASSFGAAPVRTTPTGTGSVPEADH